MAGVKRPFASLTEPDVVGRTKPSSRFVHHHQKGSSTPPSRAASPDLEPLSNSVSEFRQDATLVLVGVRGSGKSTLAVIASTALSRTVIDLEAAFQRAHGMTSSSYRKSHGTESCQLQQAEILGDLLKKNPNGRILVCSWMGRHVQLLLRDFASSNPVVHISRDAVAIKSHLNLDNERKVESLITVATIFFRTCTNLEFFNITEQSPHIAEASTPDDVFIPSLALKHAEKHFTKFLSLVYPVATIPFVDSAFPLASIPLEERQFTYIIPIPIDHILTRKFDIEEAVCGADAVEVTIDMAKPDASGDARTASSTLAADITKAVAIVRRTTVLPIICHLRVEETAEPAVWGTYRQLMAHTLKLAPEMVTIDLRLESDDMRTLLKGRRRSRVIGCREMSVPLEAWSDHYWKALYGKAVGVCCDSVRFSRSASSFQDNVEVAQFRATLAMLPDRKIPVAAYNTGSLGRTSACFNSLLTVASAAAISEMPSEIDVNSAITPMQATKSLFASFVYEPMKLYVFGAKVDYSMSPIMHNSALISYGMSHEYRPHSCTSLSSIQHLIRDPCFGGASVGLPFKVEAISLTDSLSRHARAIGAVNTLIPIRHLNDDGSVPTGSALFNNMNRTGKVRAFYGENTDWVGIKACIQSGLSPANAVRPTTCGVIIGAGGMARAAIYAMLQIGVRNIVICNRTLANAEKVVAHFQNLFEKDTDLLINGTEVRFHILKTRDEPWPADYRVPTILISCIPTHQIGDEPAPTFTAPEPWLASPTGGVVFELGYKTLDTPLLQQARAAAFKGWVAMDGLDLLPEQGFAQFELFTGRRAPRGLMRRALFQHYKDESGSPFIPDMSAISLKDREPKRGTLYWRWTVNKQIMASRRSKSRAPGPTSSDQQTIMHLPAWSPRHATAYAEGLVQARGLVRRDVSSAAIAIGGFLGLFLVVAVLTITMTWYSKRQARQKSRTQGYESTTTADTTELASATPSVAAPQPAQTAGGSGVDRNTSVRSVMTLPAYRAEASTNEQVLGRAGDRDGVDVIVDLPTEEREEALRDEEMEALYQIRNVRRQHIVEREQRRVEREAARARNDAAALADIRERSRRAREEVAASNEAIGELRQDATRAQGQRLRSVSTVSYGDLGVARHDGSRVRASSNDSERMGLLADAASISEAARPESRRSRNRSVSSFVSADSGPPSPAYSRGGSAARVSSDVPLAGSSPDLVEVPLDLGGGDDRPPPGYEEASPSPSPSRSDTLPPGYTEGSNSPASGSGELQPPAEAGRSQRSGSFTGPVPQIVIERHQH